MLLLKDIGIFKQLEKRTSETAKTYAGILRPIASNVDSLLQYIKKEFPNYPDHGLQHSLRILQYVSKILNDNALKNMTDTELFCLIMAALFHDTGMALFNNSDTSQIRNRHHEFSSIVVEKYIDDNLGIIEFSPRLKTVISFVCRSHGMIREELYDEESFSLEDTIEFDVVRFALLSSLLRIGDLMDLEQSRTDNFVLSFFAETYSVESLNHNVRHKHVKIFNYNPSEIKIVVSVENEEQLKIWKTWLDYLHNEIINANTKLKNYKVFFPSPIIDIKCAENFVKKESKKDVINIADSELVVVRSFIIGSGIDTYFKNTNIQLTHFSWDTSVLDACNDRRIDFCVFNNQSTISYMQSHPNCNIEILGTIGHSMGGMNFSAIVHNENELRGKTISEIRGRLSGYTIYVGKRNDRFRNLMWVLDVDEQFFIDNNVRIVNIPDVSTDILREDTTAIVFGGQNLRLEALSMPEFSELIFFDKLDRDKQNILKTNSENSFIVNKESMQHLGINKKFMQSLLTTFHENGYNHDKLNILVDQLANTCCFVNNDYKVRCRFVRHILYETYRFGNPVIN